MLSTNYIYTLLPKHFNIINKINKKIEFIELYNKEQVIGNTDEIQEIEKFINFIFTHCTKVILITQNDILNEKEYSEKKINKYINFSKLITDLEKINLLKTTKIDSYFYKDKRKFKFNDDAEEYFVDCLGLKINKDITNKVINTWKENFKK